MNRTYGIALGVSLIVVGFVMLMVGVVIGSPDSVPAAPVTLAPTTVAEDDGGWDCRTMGNRVCGLPGTDVTYTYLVCHDTTGRPLIVVAAPEQCLAR